MDGTSDGTTEILADQYYTYNLTLSKAVQHDTYASSTHQFPFTVIFSNDDITKNILMKTELVGTVTDFTHAAGVPAWSGIAKLKSGGSIKYIGIPLGTDVEVYETNDLFGTTYQVDTTCYGGDGNKRDNAVISGDTPTTAVAQSYEKPDYQSTKNVIDTEKDTYDADSSYSVSIINTLLLISPSGVTLRFAPYILMLALGLALLVIIRRRREED